MKKINEKDQYVIAKMNSLLTPIFNVLDINTPAQWLHSSAQELVCLPQTIEKSSENIVQFDVAYSLDNTLKKLSTNLAKNLHLSILHEGGYQCTSCQKKIKKIYSGYCYVCLISKASADMCVLNPVNCHFLKGTCREPEWGLSFCYQPHYVYLSYTDKFKVGITRKNQILTRFVDQGATMAAPLCLTSSRHQAGVLEKELTAILADKSHWQKMLKAGNAAPTSEEFSTKLHTVQAWLRDAIAKKPHLVVMLPAAAPRSVSENIVLFDSPRIIKIQYPVPDTIEKIKSISLEKEKEIKGEITGIKGQYIFFGERVFNMRNHEGFVVTLESY